MAASLVLLLVLLGQAGGLYGLYFIDKLDAALYDLKVRMFRPMTVDDRIVVVDVDEKSLKEIGRWPWPRSQVAKLTSNLFEQYGVAAVGYDVIFAEPDQSSGLPVLEKLAKGPLAGDAGFSERLARLRPQLDYDSQLAEAFTKGPAVLGYYFGFHDEQETVGALPPPALDCKALSGLGITPMQGTGYNGNLAAMQAKTPFGGFFNMQPDFDGVARRMPALVSHKGQCYGSLALNLTRAGMGAQSVKVKPPAGLGDSAAVLDLDGLTLPVDAQALAMVPYRAQGAFAYIPAADVIAGRAPAAKLEGRIVLIGSSAPGIMDLRVTPTAKAFPGVEIHANLISGILDGTVKREPARLRGMLAGATAVVGILLAAALPWLTPVWSAALALGLIAVLFGFDLFAWSALNLSLPLAAPLLAVLSLFVLNMSWGFFVEARSKAQITKLFGQYVPPELVDEMAQDPERYSLRGESRVMSVLFSDIVSFTSFSEKLEAAQLAEMLNVYLSAMTRVVQEGRGTIDKYIGDAIMAFWGAPMSDERHAHDAVLAALAMQRALTALNPRLEERGWPPVRIGVGVNTGRMSVGNMGSEFRMAYTVMADAVNLASRLEALTRQYGVGVLVGEVTREQCPEIAFRPVDRVRVKGKELPVSIYEPLGLIAELTPEQLKQGEGFEAAFADYQAQRWDEAEIKLMELSRANPLKLYQVYLDRVTHFRFNPPPADWDGAFTYTTK
ncbi:MAG: adenylate/guanylate cyclase domain-containing protein [Betaproteobacteria bacterium]|nr:adenylate/guanylate cyclase domain-containing protein [Betaproteobacteria bacterium]